MVGMKTEMEDRTRVVLEADSTVLDALKDTESKEKLLFGLVRSFAKHGFKIHSIAIERTVEKVKIITEEEK